jgi:putative acetyltransferase
MRVVPGDFHDAQVIALLRAHHEAMQAHSPPEACHVLDLSGLQVPEIAFWTVWEGDALLGCGALKQLAPDHGEIKSMRTADAHLRKGAAAAILDHIVAEARARGYRRLSLETGSGPEFEAALALYRRYGFVEGGAFGGYKPTAFTRFLHREL